MNTGGPPPPRLTLSSICAPSEVNESAALYWRMFLQKFHPSGVNAEKKCWSGSGAGAGVGNFIFPSPQHIPNSRWESVLPAFWTRSLSQCKAPNFGQTWFIVPRLCLAMGSMYCCRATGIPLRSRRASEKQRSDCMSIGPSGLSSIIRTCSITTVSSSRGHVWLCKCVVSLRCSRVSTETPLHPTSSGMSWEHPLPRR